MDATFVPDGATHQGSCNGAFFYKIESGMVMRCHIDTPSIWRAEGHSTFDAYEVHEIAQAVNPRHAAEQAAFEAWFDAPKEASIGTCAAADRDRAGILAAKQAQATYDFFSPPQGHRTLPNAGLSVVANPDERHVWGA